MAKTTGSSKERSSGETGTIKGGERISLKTAIERTKLFREYYMRKKPDTAEVIKANLFAKEAIMQVLAQPGCEGIRLYNSVNPDGIDPVTRQRGHVRELILVGIDKNNRDLLTTADYPEDGGKHNKGCNLLSALIALPASPQPVQDAVLIGAPHPCPNLCGPPNSLNENPPA